MIICFGKSAVRLLTLHCHADTIKNQLVFELLPDVYSWHFSQDGWVQMRHESKSDWDCKFWEVIIRAALPHPPVWLLQILLLTWGVGLGWPSYTQVPKPLHQCGHPSQTSHRTCPPWREVLHQNSLIWTPTCSTHFANWNPESKLVHGLPADFFVP